MILREWRGRASQSNAEAYPTHFRDKVLPELARVPGFVGAQLSKRRLDDGIEFLVLTRWRTIGAIEGFAGPEIDKAGRRTRSGRSADRFRRARAALRSH